LEEPGKGRVFFRVFRSALIEGVGFLDPNAVFSPWTAPAEGFRPL